MGRAIALANRVMCTASEERQQRKYVRRRRAGELVDRLLTDSVKEARRESLTRLFSDYLKRYNSERPELTAGVRKIYNVEMHALNLPQSKTLSVPASHAKTALNSPSRDHRVEPFLLRTRTAITTVKSTAAPARKNLILDKRRSLGQPERKLAIKKLTRAKNAPSCRRLLELGGRNGLEDNFGTAVMARGPRTEAGEKRRDWN